MNKVVKYHVCSHQLVYSSYSIKFAEMIYIFCDLNLTAKPIPVFVPTSGTWGWPDKKFPPEGGCHVLFSVKKQKKRYLFHHFFWGHQRYINTAPKKIKSLLSSTNEWLLRCVHVFRWGQPWAPQPSFGTSFNKRLSKSSPPNLLNGCKGSTPKVCWKRWASSRSSCDLSQSLKPCLPEPQQRQRWKKLQEHEVEWHPLLLKDMQKFRAWLRSIWSLLQVWMAKDAMKLGKGSPHHKIRWFLMISPPLRTGSFQKSWSSSRSKSIWYDISSKFRKYSYNWGYSAANLSFVSWCSWKREDWKCPKSPELW